MDATSAKDDYVNLLLYLFENQDIDAPGVTYVTMTKKEIDDAIRRHPMPDPQERIIDFVDMFEEAHQFYDLRKYLKKECPFLKHNSCQFKTLARLAHDPVIKRFNMVDPKMITWAIHERIIKLEAEVNKKAGIITSLLTEEKMKDVRNVMRYKALGREGVGDPIYELVCGARKGVPLNKNPQVELEKIETSHLRFYRDKFVAIKVHPKYVGRSVTITDFIYDESIPSLKGKLLECGELESFKILRWEESDKKVVATFKSLESARIAPYLLGMRWITAQRSSEGWDLKSDVEITDMIAKAIGKYKVLWNFYSELYKLKEGEDHDRLHKVASVVFGRDLAGKVITKKSNNSRNMKISRSIVFQVTGGRRYERSGTWG